MIRGMQQQHVMELLLIGCTCRSPAEGNYSEGFIQSKLTQVHHHTSGGISVIAITYSAASTTQCSPDGMQDYGIECPTTSTVFSLKTGEILVWCGCAHHVAGLLMQLSSP